MHMHNHHLDGRQEHRRLVDTQLHEPEVETVACRDKESEVSGGEAEGDAQDDHGQRPRETPLRAVVIVFSSVRFPACSLAVIGFFASMHVAAATMNAAEEEGH